MALAFPVLLAVGAGLVLGGRLGAIAELTLRAPWLFLAAIALQFVAFPPAFLPWRTEETFASVLWVASYGLLVLAAVLNRRVTGVPIVALGMGLNLAAILANRGSMPVTYEAIRDAGRTDPVLARRPLGRPRLGPARERLLRGRRRRCGRSIRARARRHGRASPAIRLEPHRDAVAGRNPPATACGFKSLRRTRPLYVRP
jgi:hypothetical protein